MSFKLKDTNIFPMPNGWPTPEGNKFIHIATITRSLKEFIYFLCIAGPNTGNAYLEEVLLLSNSNNQEVSANLTIIKDENLLEDLAAFLHEKKLDDLPSIVNKVIDQGHIDWFYS